jgi:hypothetical protein
MKEHIDAEHLCDVIKNLRLFTNTEKEWKEKYGSLYKPGLKDKLIDVLDAQCKREYDEEFNLRDFMADYSISHKNEFLDRHKRDKIFTDRDNLLALLRYQFMPKGTPIPKELIGKDYLNDFLKCDPAMLLLWSIVDHGRHQKAIPFFDERSGDVDIESYSFFIRELRQLLIYVYPKETFFGDNNPCVKMEFDKINTKLHNGTIIRMDLVMLVCSVLSNVDINNNKDELYYAFNEIICKTALSFDICGDDVMWIDPDCFPITHVFMFAELDTGYSLFRIDINTNKYLSLPLIIYKQSGHTCAYISGPKSIINAVKNKPFDKDMYMTCYVEVEYDNKIPEKFIFKPVVGNLKEMPKTLKRISEDELCNISHKYESFDFNDLKYEYPEYFYENRNVERLISADFIFVEKDSEELEDGSRNVTSWFRIPRHGNPLWSLDYIKVDDKIFHIHLSGEEYIFFDALMLSIKVTTAEDLAANNIVVMPYPCFK